MVFAAAKCSQAIRFKVPLEGELEAGAFWKRSALSKKKCKLDRLSTSFHIFPRFHVSFSPHFQVFRTRCKAEQHSKRVVSSQAEVTAQHEVNVDAAARERAKSSATFLSDSSGLVASWYSAVLAHMI